jgi:hypothetical protein
MRRPAVLIPELGQIDIALDCSGATTKDQVGEARVPSVGLFGRRKRTAEARGVPFGYVPGRRRLRWRGLGASEASITLYCRQRERATSRGLHA